MPKVAQGSAKLLTVAQLSKGDLYLRFDIHLPKHMNNQTRLAMIETLR